MSVFSIRMLACAGLLATTFVCFAQAQGQRPDVAQVDFGRDSSEWANDGECDDPRFEGPGMTATTLLVSDILGDATDCRIAFEAGRLSLRTAASPRAVSSDGIRFGSDASEWANDGECDDPRFTGPGMTETTLLDSDRFRDATDCKAAFDAGRLSLRDGE